MSERYLSECRFSLIRAIGRRMPDCGGEEPGLMLFPTPNAFSHSIRRHVAMLAIVLTAFVAAAPEPPTYYQTVGALTGEALKEELRQIISGNRGFPTTALTYSDARDALLQSVDNVGAGRIRTVYLSDEYPTSAWGTSLNREHTWPQSHGAGTGAAFTDMHHLYLCESGVNSARNNSPYGDVDTGTATVYNSIDLEPNDRNYLLDDVWQVSNNRKGDVARAILYMDTRYLSLSLINANPDGSYPPLGANQMGYLNILLLWNANDPVDALEEQRNDRVFDFQNNRNPYIDHPEYVELVFGSPAGGSDPVLSNIAIAPPVPNVGQTVTVSVNATDGNGLASVTMFYRVGTSGAYTSVAMSGGPVFTSVSAIPAQSEGTTVQYYVRAIDTLANDAFLPTGGAAGPASYLVRGDKPVITNVVLNPASPFSTSNVQVDANVEDDDGNGAGNLTVATRWRIQGAVPFSSLPMSILSGTTWRTIGAIPAQPTGTVVEYYVEATDTGAAVGTNPANGATTPASYTVDEADPFVPISSVAQVLGKLLITEIVHSTNGDGVTEWVELINNSTQGYIISNLALSDNGAGGDTGECTIVFPTGTTFPPGGIIVVFCRSTPSQAYLDSIPTVTPGGAAVQVLVLDGGTGRTFNGSPVAEMVPSDALELQLATGGDNVALKLGTSETFVAADVIDGAGWDAPSGGDATVWGPTVVTTLAADNVTVGGSNDGIARFALADTDTKADWVVVDDVPTGAEVPYTPGSVPFAYLPVELSAFGLE